MSDYWLKTILAGIFLLSGTGAAWTMLTVMGAPEKGRDPAKLRRIHRLLGYLFGLILAPLAVLGAEFFIEGGDQLPSRAVIHGLLAISLLFIFLLKVVLVRFYRNFLRMAPTLGMAVLVLTLIVFAVSAGYYILRAVFEPEPAQAGTAALKSVGDRERGAALFARYCGSCHHADREENKVGPGLKGLFKKERLPFSDKPATEENVWHQLVRPARSMPTFASLTERELADLIAYLKTL